MVDPCFDYDKDGKPDACSVMHGWYHWTGPDCLVGIPGTSIPPCSTPGWADPDGNVVWTGFFGGENIAAPRSYSVGGTVLPPTSVGARVLGQQRDDHFGTSVGSDGQWLYIAAPAHDGLPEDVPMLPATRQRCGVVYQLRTKVQTYGQPNMAQLWLEPGCAWPTVDAEIPGRRDCTVPVPHQYIIETVGSTRGQAGLSQFVDTLEGCAGTYIGQIAAALNKEWAAVSEGNVTFTVSTAAEVYRYTPYATDTVAYALDRTPQIVGPHPDARISFVRALGDVDGDHLRDFAVGSADVRDPADGASVVGAVYIVYGRPVGLEGDYLLENLHIDPGSPNRLRGVMLKGSSPGTRLARVFDSAGDFNGDGRDDVIVGNEAAPGGGEAIVVLGSPDLESPANGWTVDQIVAAGHAIRFRAAAAGDLAGANVAGAGDIDGDGYADILIAAPGAGGRGRVYLIYGASGHAANISLADAGGIDVPGARFNGRGFGDQVGGGEKVVGGTSPGNPAYTFTAHSRGVAALGDIDGDGCGDFALSAMLADPNGRIDGGEVYILYGRRK